jgi:hypothetical protein
MVQQLAGEVGQGLVGPAKGYAVAEAAEGPAAERQRRP